MLMRERLVEGELIMGVDEVAIRGLAMVSCLRLVGRFRGLPWVQRCEEEGGRYSILEYQHDIGQVKQHDVLGVAELGELLLLTVVCDAVPGDGEGDRIAAQCFETDDEDGGTPKLVVIGGVYSMSRD